VLRSQVLRKVGSEEEGWLVVVVVVVVEGGGGLDIFLRDEGLVGWGGVGKGCLKDWGGLRRRVGLL
jgi:hypothetical protein